MTAEGRRSPLAGRVVLLTRPEGRSEELAALLRREGATVLEAPAIAISPAAAPERLHAAIVRAANGEFAWVVFTSRTAVDAWFERAGGAGVPEDRRPRARVAAVGPGTVHALRKHAVEPDLVPPAYTTGALGDEFPPGRGRVLLPRADIAPEGLEEVLRHKGWIPERVEAYRTGVPEALPAEAAAALRDGRVDAVVFTSASTVRGFLSLSAVPAGARVVCIGPVTSRAARRAGLAVHAEARPHTLEGIADAVTALFR